MSPHLKHRDAWHIGARADESALMAAALLPMLLVATLPSSKARAADAPIELRHDRSSVMHAMRLRGGHLAFASTHARLHATARPVPQRHARCRMDDAGDGGGTEEPAPWWRRPPPVWPPRVDAPSLIFGDVAVSYVSAFLALDVFTTGRAGDWQVEGSALASAWIVAAAVTNAWDPTAVLPSLGLSNTLGCVARASIDLASTRVVLALAGAVLNGQAVDVKLLACELLIEVLTLALWRTYYTSRSNEPR